MTILALTLGAGLAAWSAQAGERACAADGATAGSDLPPRPAVTAADAVIPPASDFVLYHREDDGNIWLLDATGDTQIMAGAHPRLSPDGRYVLRQTTIWYGDLYVHDLVTGVDTLIFDASSTGVGGSWTGDGSHVLFDHGCSIHQAEPDGANLETIISGWPATNSCWNDNPDSNPVDGRIAWENAWYGIGLAQADGADPHWIPNTRADDYSPRWSPDGQWLAFWRDDNLYRIRPDGSELTQLSYLTPNVDWMEDTGQWTHDGQYLVAAARVGGVEGLYAAASDGSGQLTPLLVRTWTDPDWVGGAGVLTLGDTIFADGFESGSVSAWSAAIP